MLWTAGSPRADCFVLRSPLPVPRGLAANTRALELFVQLLFLDEAHAGVRVTLPAACWNTGVSQGGQGEQKLQPPPSQSQSPSQPLQPFSAWFAPDGRTLHYRTAPLQAVNRQVPPELCCTAIASVDIATLLLGEQKQAITFRLELGDAWSESAQAERLRAIEACPQVEGGEAIEARAGDAFAGFTFRRPSVNENGRACWSSLLHHVSSPPRAVAQR